MTRSRDLANFADSTEFTAADHTKLDGIEASATADQTTAQIKTAVEAAADIDLDGNPTTTTQSAGNNTTRLATTAFTQAAITALVDSSPASLNTLNELAAALGDDASFSTTVTNSIATKLPLAGGTMSGAIAMGTSKITGAGNPTAAQDLATKAYVDSASGSGLPLSGGAMTGAITTNSTFDGRDVAADGVLATNALPKAGGALTGVLTTNSNVGIGTTTINARLDVDGAAGSPATSGTTQNGIVRIRNATNNNALDIGQISGSPYGSWLQATDVSALGVEYPLHLNPNGGRVGIGVNSLTPLAPLHVRLAGSGSVPVTVAKFETISAAYGRGPQLDFNVYWGSDIPTAKIAAPNVSGGNGYGGELRFSTNGQANANSMAERMRISSSGNVGIGVYPDYKLDVAGTARFTDYLYGNANGILYTNAHVSLQTTKKLFLDSGSNTYFQEVIGDTVILVTGGYERLRVDSGGRAAIGTTPSVGGQLNIRARGDYCVTTLQVNANGDAAICFYNQIGTHVGSTLANSSSVTYGSGSDHRLKENVVYDWDATTRLKQLKPARFNFIADGADTVVDGFLAHEAQAVVPEAVTGTHNAMKDEEYEVTAAIEEVTDADGNITTEAAEAVMATRNVPDMQNIDQAKIVPLLVKTIQELEARITALEA